MNYSGAPTEMYSCLCVCKCCIYSLISGGIELVSRIPKAMLMHPLLHVLHQIWAEKSLDLHTCAPKAMIVVTGSACN